MIGNVDRVKEVECEVDPAIFPVCYDDDQENTKEFTGNGQWDTSSINGTAWLADYINPEYQSEDDLHDQCWRGKFGTYSGGGFIVDCDFNLTLKEAKYLLD